MVQSEKSGQSCSVLIGVDSFEFKQMKYHIIMTINNAQPTLLPLVVLSPQKTWQIVVPIKSPANSNVIVERDSFTARMNQRIVYRDVHLTMQHLIDGKNGSALQCTT